MLVGPLLGPPSVSVIAGEGGGAKWGKRRRHSLLPLSMPPATTLHRAAAGGSAAVLRLLLDAGSRGDLLAVDDQGRTPLHVALAADAPIDVLQLLGDASATEGADAASRAQFSREILAAALRGPAVRILTQISRGEALWSGEENVVRVAFWRDALAIGIEEDLPVALEFLLADLGVAVEPRHLLLAAEMARTSCVAVLLFHGASVDGDALQAAAAAACAPCVALLADALPDAVGVPAQVLLHADTLATGEYWHETLDAVGSRLVPSLAEYVEQGTGANAAHLAVEHGSLSVLRFLVDTAGVDATARRASDGCSPLDLAAKRDAVEMLELLVRRAGGLDARAMHLLVRAAAVHGALACLHMVAPSADRQAIADEADADALLVDTCAAGHWECADVLMRQRPPSAQVMRDCLAAAAAENREACLRFLCETASPDLAADVLAHQTSREAIEACRRAGLPVSIGAVQAAIARDDADALIAMGPLQHVAEQAPLPPYIACLDADAAACLEIVPKPAEEATLVHESIVRSAIRCLASLDVVDARVWNRSPSPLHVACAHGSAVVAAFLVEERGTLLNVLDSHGRSAAHVAAAHGHVECLAYLYSAGLPIDEADAQGKTPLRLAADADHVDAVRLLLEVDADLDASVPATLEALLDGGGDGVHVMQWLGRIDDCGQAAMHAAGLGRHDAVVKIIDDVFPDAIRARDSATGGTLLHMAALSGNADLCADLLARGVDRDVRDSVSDAHAAHVCAAVGHGSLLVDLFADCLDVVDRSGQTPLHLAARHGHANVVRLLGSIGRDAVDVHGRRPLELAVEKNRGLVVSHLLNETSDGDVDEAMRTRLVMLAVERSSDSALREIIGRFPLAVQSVDENGWTAVQVAAARGHLECLSTLAFLGGDVHMRTSPENWSLVHVAAASGHADVVRWLLMRGLAVHGELRAVTPLHLAARYGHADAVDALVAGGADRNARDANGNMALHLAARYGHAGAVSALLDKRHSGAVLADAVDGAGETAVGLAAANGHADVLHVLVHENGARV